MKTTPNRIPTRVVLYPKDVENITGRRGSTARKVTSYAVGGSAAG